MAGNLPFSRTANLPLSQDQTYKAIQELCRSNTSDEFVDYFFYDFVTASWVFLASEYQNLNKKPGKCLKVWNF